MAILRSIFALPDFRRLFAGVTTSQLGDQFALVATPWLVLQLTGDPLALGLVLALEGAPRAILMLIGGAVTDRLSPRLTLLICDVLRLGLTALIAVAILTAGIQMWMVYAFALGIGLVGGFAVPAGNSITPMIVGEEQLEPANAAVMGGSHIMGFVGPVIAGLLIGSYTSSLVGVGIAFVIDAATFAFSAVMLLRMQAGRTTDHRAHQRSDASLLVDVASGLRFVWQAETMRKAFLIVAAVNLFFVGPLMVGIPVLAEQRLAEGARAFGLLMSGFAGGNLIGYVLAGTLPKPSGTLFRIILVSVLVAFSGSLVIVGWSNSTWIDLGTLGLLGVANGYVTIVMISAIQGNTPKPMMGRVMGLFMFSSLGLVPVSQAVSGIVSRFDVAMLFWLSASLMALVAVWAAMQPSLLTLSKALAGETASHFGRAE